MIISIIVAVAKNNVIGNNNGLIWHLPVDLKYFKEKTSGHHIIMGRKNYESIGKPLPNRTSIIITREKNYRADGCIIVNSLEQAVGKVKNDPEPFIIGGGQIYSQAIDIANRLYITKIHADFEGDTFFPHIDPDIWQVISKSDTTIPDNKNKHACTFLVYENKITGI